MPSILYVEDEPALRRDISAFLDASGYATRAVASAEDALDVVRSDHPDLVLCDISLPGTSGLDLLREIRNDGKLASTPFIILSAYGDEEHVITGKREECTDYLTKPVDFDLLLATIEGHLRHAKRLEHSSLQDIICRLCRMSEYRDPETGNHIQRMAWYSKIIAGGLGKGREFQDIILLTAPMHDVGKIGIPDRILLKPGKLTDEEWAVMRQHTTIGHGILDGSPSPMMKIAAEIALSHHEKFDGSGYPNGVSEEAIPLSGRIVAVADVFDALTSKRPYKEEWLVDDALEHMRRQSGTHFDPECMNALIANIGAVVKIKEQYKD